MKYLLSLLISFSSYSAQISFESAHVFKDENKIEINGDFAGYVGDSINLEDGNYKVKLLDRFKTFLYFDIELNGENITTKVS